MDTRSPEQRSYIMRSVGTRNTGPELVVRRALHGMGLRFGLHRKDLPGKGLGQIEIDELYFGLDRRGCHYVIPVQAKGGSDQISVVQTKQDIAWCQQRFPGMQCRAISAQFMPQERVAMFHLDVQDDMVKIVDERHYKLVPDSDLDDSAIRAYRD